MDQIVALLQTRGHSLDVDNIDRFRYLHVPRVLAALSVFLFTYAYVGQPVQCWIPKQFTDKWEAYVETYCLIEGSYYVNVNASNVPHPELRMSKRIIYYQWVPFIVLSLAVALYIPRVIWRIYQKKTGNDISMIATDLRKKARELKHYPVHIDSSRFEYNFWGAILIHKMTSLVIIVILLFFLEHFFGVGWAMEQTYNLFHGIEWHESSNFPRVTFCDAQVREIGGHVNTWTVQCVLMINMFNEKVFFLIWWTLIIMFVLTIINILQWLYFITNRNEQKQLILSLIEPGTETRGNQSLFVYDVLRRSGSSFIRLLSYNVSHFELEDVVRPLWNDYCSAQSKKTDEDTVEYIDH